ncbi:hypothetical protein [Nitrosomonas sp. Nm34]|uniref:hypothetical protein n=1 Tax=Nitrosomonas sp. Nm34 TaxID=1881055 RepID=UPI0008E1FA9E|nr:hypothetical protein [Nitrosomonas sp. Nm34]SFI72893.1 hypothetical protein SAMN05428978_103030 [Nitrosomonas sp. Nm34]
MKRKLDNGYMKRKFYDSTKVLLEEIPQELYEKKFTCTNCGYVDKVPWITKRTPIKAVPVFKDSKYKGRWIPTQANLTCAQCGGETPFDMQVAEWKDNYHFLGMRHIEALTENMTSLSMH